MNPYRQSEIRPGGLDESDPRDSLRISRVVTVDKAEVDKKGVDVKLTSWVLKNGQKEHHEVYLTVLIDALHAGKVPSLIGKKFRVTLEPID